MRPTWVLALGLSCYGCRGEDDTTESSADALGESTGDGTSDSGDTSGLSKEGAGEATGSHQGSEGEPSQGELLPTHPAAVSLEVVGVVKLLVQDPVSGLDSFVNGEAHADGDGCLSVAGLVIHWGTASLAEGRVAAVAVDAGQAPVVNVSGGGFSISEGFSQERFPAGVREQGSSATGFWKAAD